MLEPVKHTLNSHRIILASKSPRRSEILKNVGLQFEVMPSEFDESKVEARYYPNQGDYAVEIAYKKVLDISDKIGENFSHPYIIIGADTVVSMDGKIFGKPGNAQTAIKYLQELRGRQHFVHTGVVIKTPHTLVKFYETCKVFMANLSDDVVRAYVRTQEPMDKAGAYGIQGFGGSLIEKIDGDFYTVMGLPLHSMCQHLLWLFEDKVREHDPSQFKSGLTIKVKERSSSKDRDHITPTTNNM